MPFEPGTYAVKNVSGFQVRPLYLQVRDALLERIKSGKLKPGGILPSEIDLHRELGVSLGTLRKALGVLEAERIIVREPGRGTFVWSRQPGRTHSRFDPIRAADGGPLAGAVQTGRAKVGSPRDQERQALQLEAGEQIVRFHRVRTLGERPFAYELVCLPDRRFPGLAARAEIPSELEELAQAWGMLVARAEAKVRALPAPAAAAAALLMTEGAMVLSLERVAYDTDERPFELMTAYYHLQDQYCRLEMR